MIIVPTVPHTGTHFMRELLAGVEDQVIVRHCYPVELEELCYFLDVGNPGIVPRRELEAVLTSWIKYGKEPSNYAGLSIDDWFRLQETLLEGRDNIYYLNLDDPGIRDEQLAIINADLDLELATDWTPVRQADDVQVH